MNVAGAAPSQSRYSLLPSAECVFEVLGMVCEG